jgi:hypothetical protein
LGWINLTQGGKIKNLLPGKKGKSSNLPDKQLLP